MGGYSTSQRPIRSRRFSFFTNGSLTREGDVDTSSISGISAYSTSEVTYGYRSKVPPGSTSVESLEEDILLSRGSRAKRYAVLHAEQRREGRTSWDNGHEFSTVKYDMVSDQHSVNWSLTSFPWTSYHYDGPVGIQPGAGCPAYRFPPHVPFSSGSYGTKAINATMPTKPMVGLAETAAELRRDFKTLVGDWNVPANTTTARTAKDITDDPSVLGEGYLSYQWGFRPVGDTLGKLVHIMTRQNALIESYVANSGKLVRRGYTFPIVRTSFAYGHDAPAKGTLSNLTGLSSGNSYWGGTGANQVPVFGQVQTEEKVWFKGAYVYYAPQGNTLFERAQRTEQVMNRLYGTRFTAHVAWNLVPFSWFIDWHSNTGEVIQNLEYLSSDGLVLAYGYLMREKRSVHTIQTVNPVKGRRWRAEYTTLSRERIRANPYGFGTTAGYSGKQWAILGALGLAKIPGVLNRH